MIIDNKIIDNKLVKNFFNLNKDKAYNLVREQHNVKKDEYIQIDYLSFGYANNPNNPDNIVIHILVKLAEYRFYSFWACSEQDLFVANRQSKLMSILDEN